MGPRFASAVWRIRHSARGITTGSAGSGWARRQASTRIPKSQARTTANMDSRGVSTSTKRAKATQGQLVEMVLEGRQSIGDKKLVDIGANLMDRSFDRDRMDVIGRASSAGMGAIVITGCCVATSTRAGQFIATAAGSADGLQLYHTAGVHPHNAKDCNDDTVTSLRRLASSDACVAIGECGLDFNRNFSPPETQIKWFEEQVKLANDLQMPLFIHCRDAGRELTDVLRRTPPTVPVVIHCFTGETQELREFVRLGYYIGITGWVCDDRPERGAEALRDSIKIIPENRLMIETDAPYLTPRCIKPSRARPGRNEPALLPVVLETVASVLGKTVDEVADITSTNSRTFFGI